MIVPANADIPVLIDAWTFDVGVAAAVPKDYIEACASRVEQSWDLGADIVLFPEYTWAGLEPLLPPGVGLPGVAQFFWSEVVPDLQKRLSRPDKLVVLGTAPFIDSTSGVMLNRAPILSCGELLWQDKMFLTPWETAFTPGDSMRLFQFKGLRVAVLICLDIEIPELSALLRGQGVDLILNPSATETLMGCERVTRCASARAVELCCAVATAPLVGRCQSELVDQNLGKMAYSMPSQKAFDSHIRMQSSEVWESGFQFERFSLARRLLTTSRGETTETNPALIDLGQMMPRLIMD